MKPAAPTVSNKRPPVLKRLLGDARRETSAAVFIAASKRRRLERSEHAPFDDEDDDNNPTDTRALDDNDVAVFADAVYEEDDAEADEIYAQVEQRMSSRRQKQREETLKEQLKKYRDANPTVKQQFADLKADLQNISNDEWASIPDIGDRSIKKHTFDTFTPVPDSVLAGAKQSVGYVATDSDGEEDATDLAAIGQGRTSVLGQNLDRAGSSATENATVDADNYLSQLSGMKLSAKSELGDVKRARRLLECITDTNALHAPGWIAAARLEETLGELSVARQKILQGCRRCPKDEDVWVEAARMHHDRKIAKRILAMAVKNVPRSSKIWLQAAALESDTSAKRRVLRKALEVIPKGVDVWKAAVELEDAAGARLLLHRAVESVPEEVDMWTALARLETYEKAKLVLKRAQEMVPVHASVWVTAAQLEEAEHGPKSDAMLNIMQQAVKHVEISRQAWKQQAIVMEQSGYAGTVQAIIRSTIGIGVATEEREERWVEEANEMEAEGHREVARAIYIHVTDVFSSKEEVWAAFADFERRAGEHKRVQAVLQSGIEMCAGTVVLWLMLAKHKWKVEGADGGRQVLQQALARNSEQEELWLAAAKIETESGELQKARAMLQQARERAGGGEGGRASARVVMKSALLERLTGDEEQERLLLEEGVRWHTGAVKLWLMLAQWYERREEAEDGGEQSGTRGGSFGDAGEVYAKAAQQCGAHASVWVGYARWEERHSRGAKARALLERARAKVRGTAELELAWHESVCLERRLQSGAAKRVLARALQQCARSGRLWALAVAMEDDVSAKARGVDAIRACGEDAWVLLEVARVVWRAGRLERAARWLRRAVAAAPRLGDAWAALLALERERGGADGDGARAVERDACAAEPAYGELWVDVAKRRGNEQLSALHVLRAVAARCPLRRAAPRESVTAGSARR